ncbi:hypothetical protein [Dysgonomonas sp. 511]|uniref:hypothetical protein n=1 Tax=Dysgonomonas sp. 511 TaxID=2302930 RepID=UPI0013D1C307|nr:hypothetical protein [Dysgonomonas sp. 511]NDV77865.1 hypothetical protein [Dysgonomonas sp. 511]
MAKKQSNTGIDLSSVDLNFIEDNYMSYEECLKYLFMKRPTLQQHIREGKKFIQPGDTLILPNKKRVFLREAVRREVVNLLRDNGVK